MAPFDLQAVAGLRGCQSGKALSVPLYNGRMWCVSYCRGLKIVVIRLVHGMGKQFYFK